MDGETLAGLLFLPFFLRDLAVNYDEIKLFDVVFVNTCVVLNLLGNIMFSYGLKYGYAGRITAIDAGQVVIEVFIIIVTWF